MPIAKVPNALSNKSPAQSFVSMCSNAQSNAMPASASLTAKSNIEQSKAKPKQSKKGKKKTAAGARV